MNKSILALLMCLLISEVRGQQTIPDFTLTNVLDGTAIALSDYSKPVVIIFVGNDCAFDNFYAARIKSLIDIYSSRVQFLLINASIEPGDAADKMVTKCKAWKYDVPYLADKNQQVMEMLGARKSPEAFLVNKANGRFLVIYRGAVDDNPQVASDVKQTYLKTNLDRVLAGQKIDTPEIRTAGGCTIRKK